MRKTQHRQAIYWKNQQTFPSDNKRVIFSQKNPGQQYPDEPVRSGIFSTRAFLSLIRQIALLLYFRGTSPFSPLVIERVARNRQPHAAEVVAFEIGDKEVL